MQVIFPRIETGEVDHGTAEKRFVAFRIRSGNGDAVMIAEEQAVVIFLIVELYLRAAFQLREKHHDAIVGIAAP